MRPCAKFFLRELAKRADNKVSVWDRRSLGASQFTSGGHEHPSDEAMANAAWKRQKYTPGAPGMKPGVIYYKLEEADLAKVAPHAVEEGVYRINTLPDDFNMKNVRVEHVEGHGWGLYMDKVGGVPAKEAWAMGPAPAGSDPETANASMLWASFPGKLSEPLNEEWNFRAGTLYRMGFDPTRALWKGKTVFELWLWYMHFTSTKDEATLWESWTERGIPGPPEAPAATSWEEQKGSLWLDPAGDTAIKQDPGSPLR